MEIIQSPWRLYKDGEFQIIGDRYQSLDGEWLILHEHPISGRLGGVRESDLDILRQDFTRWLRDQLVNKLDKPLSRPEKLRETALFIVGLLQQSPPPHDWPRLPADSRPERNRNTLAYHALLVSGFACAMARAWLEEGKSISELLRFQVPAEESELPVEVEELIHFIRVASLCHDFGKHPPQLHHVRGREQVKEIFYGLMPEMVVFSLSEAAFRHHTGQTYRKRDESPIGILEELIAHADTLASAADRPVSADGRADPVEPVTRFFEEDFGDKEALSLISADTDRVKTYVFETARLPEGRGASALLTKVNERRIAEILWEQFRLPRECLLYAAGGSALIVAPTRLAERIADKIQRLYLSETSTATITVVSRPTSPREWVKGVEISGRNFGSLVKWTSYELRRAKESRAYYPFFDAPPYARRCDSCEVRPAEHKEKEPGGNEIFLCGVCRKKRRFGRDQKSLYLQCFEEFLKINVGSKTPYGEHFMDLTQTQEPSFAKDLREISEGAEGKAKGYVGIIYADGNDIGRKIENSRTPADFRTLSEELRNATKLATFKAISQCSLLKKIKCTDRQERWIHPFEIVTIGGDDVFLVVPGDVALNIALGLCEEFGELFNGNLTMSAGVLVMHDHFPIYYARNIVERLLKSAKKAGRKARVSNGPVPAYVDFQVVSGDTSLSEDLEEYRVEYYSAAHPLSQIERLTRRPYTLGELRQLLLAASWAKRKFPASQLYQLRQSVVEHLSLWSQNWYHYQIARDDEERESGWREFHRKLFGSDPLSDTNSPWQWEDKQLTTPVVDLVEILDYVRTDGGDKSNET